MTLWTDENLALIDNQASENLRLLSVNRQLRNVVDLYALITPELFESELQKVRGIIEMLKQRSSIRADSFL